jgi:hypothetical protein
MSDKPIEGNSGIWKVLALSLLSGAIGFYTNVAINMSSDNEEKTVLTRQEEYRFIQISENIVYIKEAVRIIFQNQATMFSYLKQIARKEGIYLE